jgi:membrane protein YqaA with SNARE-associated domain
MADVNQKPGAEKKSQTGKRVLGVAMVFLTIALTVGLFVFAQRYPDKVKELAGLGYIGVALISLVSSATIILPVPGVLIAFPLVTALNPVLVALAASTGGIFGEISGYMAGFGGQELTNAGGIQMRAKRWMQRWGSLTIFLFAAVPLVPFDIAGVIAGALKYPLWKFFLMGWLGKSIKFIALVYAFIWGWDLILRHVG